MRIRLRDAHPKELLGEIYSKPHSHFIWKDHRVRVAMTIAFSTWFEGIKSVADLSAGDATIINAISAEQKYIGDFAPGYEFTGAIDETIEQIPNVDLFICSETIEHLDDPETTLKKIRIKTRFLIITTPNGENDSSNHQHYWGWDMEGVQELLQKTGFKPLISNLLQLKSAGFTYDYQFWGCE